MSPLTGVLLAMAIAAPAIWMWIVLVQLPALAHSRYRHELWEIHDALLEEVIEGRIDKNTCVLQILDGIDALIITSDWQTPIRLEVMFRGVHFEAAEPSPLHSDEALLSRDDLPAKDRDYVLEVTRSVRRSTTRHLRTATIAGRLGIHRLFRRPSRIEPEPISEELMSARFRELHMIKDPHVDGPHLRPVG